MPGVFLEHCTWVEAEALLTPATIMLLPLGAAAKEHGPHMWLSTDRILAEYLTQQVCERAEVVVAPMLTYNYYPAFVEYPGSVSLRLETARDLLIDICRSLAAFGPRRFYVLNTGVSTVRALAPAAEMLAAESLILHYTNLPALLGPIEHAIAEQAGGSHADEIETSILLAIAPETVTMARAIRDYHPAPGPLTRHPDRDGAYSASGIYGDPTLATAEKGHLVLDALVAGIRADLDILREA